MFRKSLWHHLNSRRIFFVLAAIGFIFKYWLVLGDEIEPFYRPADDLNYVLLAKSWYWWADYNAYSLIRGPIFPLYLALVHQTEIPLRIVQELFLCGGAFFMVNRFRKNGLNATVAAIVFIITILHPGWLLLANRTLRECYYTTLLMVLIAQLVPLANRKLMTLRWYQLLPVGITSALLWHSREESLLIAILLMSFVAVFWLLKQELPVLKVTLKQLGWVSLGLVTPILVTNLVVRSLNYSTHGLFISQEFADPAFTKALKMLMQIKPDKPKAWATVEKESLEKAYEVSPTLSLIKDALSNRVGPRWAAATQSQTKDPEEMGGSSIIFALRESAMEEGFHSNALKAHAFYKNIAEELEQGFRSGRLKKRLVISSYIDPEISDFMTRLPEGLIHVGSFAYKALQDNDIRIYYPRYEVFKTLDVYDEIANRRHYLAYRKVCSIRGWAFVEGKEVYKIEVIDDSGTFLDMTTNIYDRPDVMAAFEQQKAPLKSGFEIALPKADYPNENIRVVFHTTDGHSITIAANSLLQLGQVQGRDSAESILRVTVDELKTGRNAFATQDAIQAWLWLNHGKFHLILGGTALLLLLIRYALFKPGVATRHYYRWICYLLIVFVSRWFLITLFDISSFRMDLRYIFPVLIFLPLLFGLILQEALAGFKAKHLRW